MRRCKHRFLAFLLASVRLVTGSVILFYTATSIGQTHDLSFGRRSSEDGLSQSTVNAILQDRHGFIWIGTEDGLNRYDGYTFTIYRSNPADSTSLSDNWIMSLCEDSTGNIWIGTYNGGLNRYDPIHDRFIRYRHDPKDSTDLEGRIVTALLCDANGTLWVALWKRGIDRLDPGAQSFVHYRAEPGRRTGLGSDEVRSLYQTTDGAIWAGTWSGLYRMDTTRQQFERVLDHEKVFCLSQDQQNFLWVGTWGEGVLVVDVQGRRVRRHQADQRGGGALGTDYIGALCPDPKGGMWIGTWGGGLSHTARTGFERFVHHPSIASTLSSNEILSLSYDRSGTLWIGTERGGLSFLQLHSRHFALYKHLPGRKEGLQYNNVKSVLSARNGDLWVGTLGGGLDRYNRARQRWEHYANDPANPLSLSHNTVLGIFEDFQGKIWVGTAGGTLCRFESSRSDFKRYDLGKNDLTAITGDSSGVLWIGTDENGLIRYDPRTATARRFRNDPGDPTTLCGNSILTVSFDHQGALWVGTWGTGLSRLDPATGRCQRFQHGYAGDGTISDNTVLAIHEDSGGTLWIGTRGGGLNRFDRSTGLFKAYTERDGLPNNVVYAVLSDNDKRLWLSTNKGIACLTSTGTVSQSYTASDGLQGNEFSQGAACRDNSGRLFFGGTSGMNSFVPNDLEPSPSPPRVIFTGFKVFDVSLPMDTAITLAHNVELSYEQNHFTFEFSALDIANVERVAYRYKLEGFDRQWISAGSSRSVSYTHLDPGTYLFQVKAAGVNGSWGERASSITLVITPPFWRTWWFTALGVVLLLGATFFLYRVRVRHLLGEERLRISIASDLHDELAANLSSITMYSTIVHDALASRSQDIQQQHLQLLERISTLGRDSVTSIRDIIWATDPRVETTKDLLIRLEDAAGELCRAKGIRMHTDFPNPSQFPRGNLSPDRRRDLWLLLKEAVTNAIRHSGCSELVLSSRSMGDQLRIVVRDNGAGFSPDRKGQGDGLETMEMRAKRLGARLRIDSGESIGTTVTVWLSV